MNVQFLPLGAMATAAISGCLYSLSNVGFGYWPLAFIQFIPLWLAIDALSLSKHPLRNAAFLGFVFGLSAFSLGFPWLLTLTDTFLGSGIIIGVFLWCLLGIWFSLGFSFYALLYSALRKAKTSQILATTTPFILVEWLQPSLFPSYAGASLISEPVLAQTADLGGPLILSAFVVSINAAIYAILKSRLHKLAFPLVSTLLSIILILTVYFYGEHQIAKLIEEQGTTPVNTIKIGAIQSNLVMLDKHELAAKSHQSHLKQSKELLSNGDVDLLIWPETAYVRGLRRPLPIDAQFIRQDIDVALLFGGTSIWQRNGKKVSANSVFLADKNGEIDQVYDKTILIPFAEYIPFSNLLSNFEDQLDTLFPQRQNFHSEGMQNSLNLGEVSLITPICYEIIFAEEIRELVKITKPNLIITVANDAWFGFTQEPWIHLSLARLRAIEHRLWMVRSTNSGISAVIDPAGNIITQTGLHTRENLRATVYPRSGTTFYTQYGNWVGWLSLCFVFYGFRKLRRKPVNSPQVDSQSIDK